MVVERSVLTEINEDVMLSSVTEHVCHTALTDILLHSHMSPGILVTFRVYRCSPNSYEVGWWKEASPDCKLSTDNMFHSIDVHPNWPVHPDVFDQPTSMACISTSSISISFVNAAVAVNSGHSNLVN